MIDGLRAGDHDQIAAPNGTAGLPDRGRGNVGLNRKSVSSSRTRVKTVLRNRSGRANGAADSTGGEGQR